MNQLYAQLVALKSFDLNPGKSLEVSFRLLEVSDGTAIGRFELSHDGEVVMATDSKALTAGESADFGKIDFKFQ